MAAQFGFVYLLGHPNMPNIFKIGCTDRSPHLRAQELSSSTSVPAPFHVLCYFETEAAPVIEHALHETWGNFRVSPNREFFEVHEERHDELVGYFRWHPTSLAFTDVSLHRIRIYDIDETPDPWEPKRTKEEPSLTAIIEAEESVQCQFD